MKIPERIETKRLILRLFEYNDLDYFFNLICNIESNKFLNFIPEKISYEKVSTLINFIIKSYNTSNPVYIFAVTSKESDVFIGFCGLLSIDHYNELKCIYALLPQYRSNGYMIESLKNLFEYGFTNLELTKIVAFIPKQNRRAWKVAERAGMKYLGDVRYKKDKKAMFFSIDKSEFHKQTSY